jgi:hypothetical protein
MLIVTSLTGNVAFTAVATCAENGPSTAVWHANPMPTITTNHVFELDHLLNVVYKCSETVERHNHFWGLPASPFSDIYAFTITLESAGSRATSQAAAHHPVPMFTRPVFYGNTYARNLSHPFTELAYMGFVIPSYSLQPRAANDTQPPQVHADDPRNGIDTMHTDHPHHRRKWRFRLEMRNRRRFFSTYVLGQKITAVSGTFDILPDPENGQGLLRPHAYIPDAYFRSQGEEWHESENGNVPNSATTISAWFHMRPSYGVGLPHCQKIVGPSFNDYSWVCGTEA